MEAQSLQLSICSDPADERTPDRRPAIVDWLEARLSEERRLLKCRHTAICEALLLELSVSDVDIVVEPFLPEQNPVIAEAATAVAADLTAVACQGSPSPPPQMAPETPQAPSSSQCFVTPQTVAFDMLPKKAPSANALPGAHTRAEMFRQLSPAGTTSTLRSKADQHADKTPFQRAVLGTTFEAVFGILIVTNSAIMALEVQYLGLAMVGESIGPGAWVAFHFFEWFFGVVFTLEVILKIAALKREFVWSFWNMFDSIIVAFWMFSSAVTLFPIPVKNPMIFRICRLVRLLRMLRLVKTTSTSMFETLVLLMSSIQACGVVLFWGMLLLLMFMTVSALVLNSLLTEVMDPKTSDLTPTARGEIYRLFGTYTRSMITMFAVTLADWVGPCRLLVDYVDERYALFFLTYKCVVGFAVLKVITGVFLHETFRCADLDDDLMIQKRRRMRTKFKMKMLAFFDEADGGSGSEEVSCEAFVEMIKDDRVNTWLEAMDLRIRDVGAERIFAFLAGPDRKLTREELCSGMSRLRGAAQGLDIVTLLEIAHEEICMPPSRDLLRLQYDKPPNTAAGPRRQEVTQAPTPQLSAEAPPQKSADTSAGAAEIRWATAELLVATSDLRLALAHHEGALRPSCRARPRWLERI